MNKALLLVSFLFLSCTQKQACMPYRDMARRDSAPDKKTMVRFSGDNLLRLDYVRVSEGKYPNYGRAELDSVSFSHILRSIDPAYSPKNVWMLTLYSEKADLYEGDTVKPANLKAYLVAHLDGQRHAMLDFKDLSTGKTETYRVSSYYATVKNYFLRHRTPIKDMPGLIDIVNKDLDKKGVVLLPKAQDTLYHLANKE